MPEENLLIRNEFVHVKIFRAPTGKTFRKKFVLITVLAVSTCLVIGGFIFLATHFDQMGEEDETQRQTTLTLLKMQTTNQILLNYLRGISNSKTISGISVGGGRSNEVVRTIQKIAGVSPGIIATNMPSYTSSATEWISFVEEVISNWNNRHLVHMRWFRGHPLAEINNFTDTSNKVEAERRWGELIKEGGILNQIWKNELDKMAPHLHKLQSARVVPIVDILPHINYKGGIWRGRPGVNGTAKLYQITRDYLTKQHNLTSLIWNWSLDAEDMTHFEEFWPGSDHVDVTTVNMWDKKELPMSEYERLINLVGDKPLSMEVMSTVPSLELLTAQPRWTWFAAIEDDLENINYNNAGNIKETLISTSVINKGNIDFFNDIN